MSMNVPLRLPFVTRTRNATILLAHTGVLVTLGTPETGKHAQVRNLDRTMSLGNIQDDLLSSFLSVSEAEILN